jgi:hypothetical protein
MLCRRAIVACGVSIAAASCSTHPLPEDVAGKNTYQIVAQIRCEARDGIRSFARGVIRKGNPELADALKTGAISYREALRRLGRDKAARGIREALAKYEYAAIAYDFTFDITEANKLNATADLLSPFSRGTFTLGATAGSTLQRENTRNFRIADSFGNLAINVTDKYCRDVADGSNWIYPITGKIGVGELIGTFLNLNQSGNLSGTKDKPDIPRIADTIAFTTKLQGTLTPRIVLTPISHGFNFTGASLTADDSRQDVDTVIVAISLPKPNAKQAASRMIDYQVYRNSANVNKQIEDRILALPQ